MAVPYAKDSDIYTYDKSLKDVGEESFAAQLLLASNDVLNLIKGTWWPSATETSLASFDEANLDDAALVQLTVFKALGDYVFPSLSKFTETDIFKAKAEFYQGKFKEEWANVKGLPLYDFNKDTVHEDTERPGPFSHRMSRG